ncbi:MAG TPA: serine/threonine-protein kinase, partial [Chloroflexota bacterium]
MEIARGRYRLIRRLGEGGTGVVYQAVDLVLGRTVAIKALHPAFDTELLRREGRSLAQMSHPGVVALHDLVEHHGRPYLVMEYVDGCNLEQWLARIEAIDLEKALSIFTRIARIVVDAHALGLLHCDLKPANVLVSTAGEIKLSDFTLARLALGGRLPAPAGGSERYAAPEALRGGHVDARADVYGLGAILRRLLESASETSPAETQIRAVIARSTAALPDDRYSTAAELLEALPPTGGDLTRISGRSAVSELTRILPRSGATRRKTRILTPAITAVAAVAIVGGAIFSRF